MHIKLTASFQRQLTVLKLLLNFFPYQLTITKKRYALVTMCIGVGQGAAVVFEGV